MHELASIARPPHASRPFDRRDAVHSATGHAPGSRELTVVSDFREPVSVGRARVEA